ncbi:MAG: hypothetical protein GX437_06375 [Sphingobacteriales bacterium]|nr:hypothetical protein [Sphingobacteriales bacterium]
MNLRHIFLFPLLISTFGSNGQTTDISIPEKIKNRMNNIEILGFSQNNYYVVRYNKAMQQEFVFSRYNKDLQLAGQLEFQIDKGNDIEEILLVDKNIHIYYSAYDREEKAYKLYCTVLTGRLAFQSRDNLVASAKVTSSSKTFRITYDKVFKRVLVMYPKSIENDLVNFGFVQLSPSLEVLKTYQSVIVPEKEFSVEQLSLAAGNAGMIIRRNISGGFLKGTKEQLSFLRINLEKESVSSVNLFNDSLSFSSVVYKFDYLNNRFVFSGFYHTDDKETDKGLGVIFIPVTVDSLRINFIPFSTDMIATLEGAGSNKKGLRDFYAKKVFLRDDGGFLFLAEKFTIVKEVMNNYYSLNNVYIRYFYRFSDVLVVSVNPYGNITWTKVIRKEQTTLNDEGFYSSFHSTSLHNKVVIFFNDISRSSWNLIYNTIDPDGNINYQILYTSANLAGTAIPRNARQVNASEVIIPVINVSKGFSLLRVRF